MGHSKTLRVVVSAVSLSAVCAIYAGTPLKPGTMDWLTALTRVENGTNIFICGASLIDPFHVLTAAHCAVLILSGGTVGCTANTLDYFCTPALGVSWEGLVVVQGCAGG
jgi:hypothetical protein